MQTRELHRKIDASDVLLQHARKLAEEAQSLPEGDDKRQWLEAEAEKLTREAEQLHADVNTGISKYTGKSKRK